MDKILLKKIKDNPKYVNSIENIDNETLMYAIHFGYKYMDDIDDKFCKKDFYVRFNIKKDRDFIKFFMNSKHFTFDRFEDDEQVREEIIKYAIDNDLCDNPIIMYWIKLSYNLEEHLEDAGICFINSNMLIEDNLNLFNKIKQIYLIDNDIDTINLLIEKVKKRNVNINYINVILERKIYSEEELNQIKDKNFVKFCSASYKKLNVDELIQINKFLDLCVNDIKMSNLSPYEKYIAVYNIVKSFKKYRVLEDKSCQKSVYNYESNNVYSILNNLYLICDKYSELLEILLKIVGINNISLNYSQMNCSVNYVNLVDEKYDINGFYICDVDNDNSFDMMMDSGYSNLHILTQKFNFQKDKENIDYIFDKNVYEIYEYISVPPNYEKVMNAFFKLDDEFYNVIKEKEDNIELAKEIYRYLRNKINNSFDRVCDIKAILEVKQFILGRKYTEEEYEFEKNKLINLNPDIFANIYVFVIEEMYKKIKNMTINNFIKYKNGLDSDKIEVLENALAKINNDYFKTENDIYYFLNLYDEDISFNITLDCLSKDKTEEIVKALRNLGYDVYCIDDDIVIFRFLLDKKYYNKLITNIYNDLELIKNDFIDIYKKSVFRRV